MLFFEPVVTSFAIFISFCWMLLYLLLDSIPIIFTELYGFDTGVDGLIFSTSMVGCIVGVGIDWYCAKLYRKNVHIKGPEARLYTAMAGGVLLPIGAWICEFFHPYSSSLQLMLLPSHSLRYIHVLLVRSFHSSLRRNFNPLRRNVSRLRQRLPIPLRRVRPPSYSYSSLFYHSIYLTHAIFFNFKIGTACTPPPLSRLNLSFVTSPAHYSLLSSLRYTLN